MRKKSGMKEYRQQRGGARLTQADLFREVGGGIVTYSRGVTVKRGNGNGYEYDRFDISLADRRGAGESYDAVFERLRTAVHDMLVTEIIRVRTGERVRVFTESAEAVRKEFGL
jgi:hypothetical protein